MINRLSLIVAAMLLVCGCAGTAVRKEAPGNVVSAGPFNVKSVNVVLSSKAKEQIADDIKFDIKAFASTVERTLSDSGLLYSDAANSLEIEVTNIYIKGTFSAIMFGAMAGADNITGNVRALDPKGIPLRSYEISASYGLGGLGGGQDSIRINYLYKKFADLARDELRDQK